MGWGPAPADAAQLPGATSDGGVLQACCSSPTPPMGSSLRTPFPNPMRCLQWARRKDPGASRQFGPLDVTVTSKPLLKNFMLPFIE